MNGIHYPDSIEHMNKFERQNGNISVYVFNFEGNEIVPLTITTNPHRLHHVNLLLIKYGQVAHYCLIKDLNSFLYRSKSHSNKLFFCPYCLHAFIRNDLLQKHIPYRCTNGAQKVELPVEGDNDVLVFTDYQKELKVPFVIYADFETLNTKISNCIPDPQHSGTTLVMKLEVCGYAYKVVCADSRYTKPTVIYRGSDASYKFIESLLEEQKEIEQILNNVESMIITTADAAEIDNASFCCLCKRDFTPYDKTYSKVVRHHDHLTGKFIGMAHSKCNLKCRQDKCTRMIFHNLKKFDAHISCQSVGQFKEQKLSCIAQHTENYVSFQIGRLKFLDSLQFLPSSLENLGNDLKADGLEAFPHLVEELSDPADAKLLLRKGVYPYGYVDSEKKFAEQKLPPREAFYSELKKESISDEDYSHAMRVFDNFEMKHLGDYHDLYLKMDVILLCDVFERFRHICMEQYGLDSCHFYTSPGLSWASCLKMTDVKLELLTDIDQVLFIERGIRGGANNLLLSDYDAQKERSHILYLDMNNLYGCAMQQSLPTSDFRFMNKTEVENLDIVNIAPDADRGYIFEIDLKYPAKLHDTHNEYPLAPERQTVNDDMLSPYAQFLWKKLHGKPESDELPSRGKVEKLITSLEDKKGYIVHYRILQLYIQLGLEVTGIHRVLEFTQKPWLKSYIDFNTEQRKKAKSLFSKNFYKLMNNSCFGKVR